MKKIWKGKKALSPVVAAIILIAVTVAVSIAVAAWMGALTFTFMSTKELKITSMTFSGSSGAANNTISITVTNPGTGKVTVGTIKVNDVSKTFPESPDFEAGTQHVLTVQSVGWTSGNKYKVTLLSTDGTPVGAYEAVA
ncbi:MAG: hypothetical protein JSV29_00310 [Candidatus Bathyarchaeota archaeon]|nr:MAG: hypothetical protein JSV29_00310 [Candidatus Bathyarchaeota archaeon]